ncbi:MAG: peptidylprolyl isomerase [Betaproteobacteria bacterium]|nr:peptidylprolyl isomerase [Betaproteobacteria bacterium]
MFDFIDRNKRVLQLILALLIIPPFAFFGVDTYLRGGDSSPPVASVNGLHIAQHEFNLELRERQEVLQNMAGGKADAAMLDNPEVRLSVAESLVNRTLLLQHASRARLTVPDQQLQTILSQAPQFQEDGKFSKDRYEQFLRARGRTEVAFETDIRRDLMLQQAYDPYGPANFLPRTVVQRLARLTETQREASIVTLAPERFESKVTLEPDAAKKFYDSHPDEFRIPEQVRVEYVVLSLDAMLPAVTVNPEDVKRVYDDQVRRMTLQETRQASHILVAVDAQAPAADKQAARAKAADLLKQVQAKPAIFADLAKAHSQDPGSAVNGGDLGLFKRGDMTKPFADAAFGMKVGEISGLVESEFGIHIIRLTAINPAKAPAFEAQRAQIENELKRNAARKDFAAKADQFNEIVFTQPDSLKPAAELIKAPIEKSGFVSRAGGDTPLLGNPKLLQAIFSEDVLKNKRNTEAVEVAPGVLVAARVLEHKPAALRPFEDVQSAVAVRLTRQRAAQLAAQEGRAMLESLRQGKDAQLQWGGPQMISFTSQIKGLSEDVKKQILRVDVSKLPAYSGVETPAGYTLIRITRTVEPEKIDVEKEKGLAQMLAQAQGQEQNAAFLASLKQNAKINIRKDQLNDRKDR